MPQIVPLIPAITGGMGAISNIIRGNRVNSAQKAALANQQQLQGMINNPALLAQKVQQMEQPLNQGLVQGVENTAQAGLAERGLGTSPQIANEVFGQALGPYEQQNQQAALSAVLKMMGMDQDAINTIIGAEGQPTNTSGLYGSLQSIFAPQQPGTINTSGAPIPRVDPGIALPPVPTGDVPGGDTGPPNFPVGTDMPQGPDFFPGLEGLFQ